ncbi:GAF domain-containing sensor histidine kinase (plasmid) [Tistrella mobilis]|uniref:GAF domain-containing sensor histidine kinase n=1 Tax=Tistrella mobilis TaxID=171437 RepID=UPI00355903C6
MTTGADDKPGAAERTYTPAGRDPARERRRLAHLDRLGVLDTPPEPGFDRIVNIVADICQAPIVLVSLIDRDRQWFKARRGLDVSETPRDWAFCDHALARASVLEVPDAAQDPRFAGNPLVVGPPFIRFYAGAPIRLSDGIALGTLCVIDPEPRPDGLDDRQTRMLEAHAALVAERLQLMAANDHLRDQMDLAVRVQTRLVDMAAAPGQAVQELAHELRTPLCSTMGYAALIAADDRLPRESRNWAGSIEEAGRWMLGLVNRLLARPAADAGRVPGVTDLREPLAAALRLVHGLSLEAGVLLEDRLAAGPVMARADAATIQQVAVNLLANAIKYTPAGGMVRLDIESRAGRVGFTVLDTGPGVAPERLGDGGNAILGQGAEPAVGGGSSGMGLDIARRLVEGQGGRIEIGNRSGLMGLVVTVWLRPAAS